MISSDNVLKLSRDIVTVDENDFKYYSTDQVAKNYWLWKNDDFRAVFLWFKERRIRGPSFSTMTLGLQWALPQRQLPEPHSTKTFSHCLTKENSLGFPVQVENFVLLLFFCFLMKLHIVNIAFGNSVKR